MSINRRKYLSIAGATAVAGLAGCTGGQSSESGDGGGGSSDDGGSGGSGGGGDETATATPTTSQASGELEQTEINYLGTYFPDAVFGALHAAEEKGFFEEVGLNVNIEYSLEVQNTLQILLSGKYDFVGHTPIATIIARSKGIPVRNVATYFSHPPTSFFSKKEDGIESVEDWPGHTLGLQNENDRLWFTHEMYKEIGFSESQIDDIDQVFTGYSINNLMTGKVDILSGYPTNSDFNSLRLAGEEFNVQSAADYLDVPGNNLICPEKLAQEAPNTVREFYRAYAKGMEYSWLTPENFQEMAEMTVEKLEAADAGVFLGDVDPVEVEINNYEQLNKFTWNENWADDGLGYSYPERWDNLQQIGLDIGDLSNEQDMSNVVNNEFVEAVTADDGSLIWPPE